MATMLFDAATARRFPMRFSGREVLCGAVTIGTDISSSREAAPACPPVQWPGLVRRCGIHPEEAGGLPEYWRGGACSAAGETGGGGAGGDRAGLPLRRYGA